VLLPDGAAVPCYPEFNFVFHPMGNGKKLRNKITYNYSARLSLE
jgi:hypothetical protein